MSSPAENNSPERTSESVVPPRRPHDWRFDLIRVFAAFGVVVAHTTGFFQIAPEPTALGALAVFAHDLGHSTVPLFFLTAGYFALTRIQNVDDVPRFWRKRLKRVWIPTLFWSACYVVLYLASYIASGRSVDAARVLHDWLWMGKPGAGYHLWFLYVLFAVELFAPWVVLARKKRRRRVDAGLFALWLASGVYTVLSIMFCGDDGRGRLFFGVLAVGYLPWYCWGELSGVRIRRMSTFAQRQLGNVSIFIAVVGVCAMVAATYFFGDSTFPVGYRYARSDFLPPSLLLAFGLWSYALTRSDAAPPGVERALRYFGELSFGIYVLHIAVLALVTRVAPSASETVPGALALSVVAFFCSALLAAIIKKTPYLRRTL